MSAPVAQLVYILSAFTSAMVTWLLWGSYRKTGFALLFWSALCFLGLTLNNILVFVDLILLPQTDLAVLRVTPAVLGFFALVYGLVKEAT